MNPQLCNFGSEAELSDVKETIQQLLRWGWKYNKNLEEQAAQLHMLTGWSQIVEVHYFSDDVDVFEKQITLQFQEAVSDVFYLLMQVSASRKTSLLENQSEVLYQ